MSKKVLALVLALVMVLGSFSFVSAADYSDVEGTEYEEAVARLSLLGVLTGYPDGSFKPENTITRAEFAAVAVRAKGLANAAEASKGLPTGFSDVQNWHWASGIVGTAAKTGVVNGIGNGLFAPEAPVKYEEAITMLVRALGYEAAAQTKGGYPYGYLIVGNEIGLLDEVKGTQGAPASRGIVAQMTDNALEIPMMIQVGFGQDTKWVVSGSKEHGDNASEQYLLDSMGFDSVKGRVTNVNSNRKGITVSVEDEDEIDRLGKTRVSIDVPAGFDIYEVEGVEAKFWYKDDIVISKVLEDAKFDAIKYIEKDEELELITEDEEYDIAKSKDGFIEITINGDDYDKKDAKTEADYAKVVFNKDDEVIWAQGYTFDGFLVVEKVDGTDVIGADNYDEVDAKDFLIVKDGKEISVEDLEEGDVFYYNDDEEFAVVSNKSITGEIERVYANNDQVKFAGKNYDIAPGAIYLDEEGKVDEIETDILDELMDEEEEVTMFFNFRNEVVLVLVGDVTGSSDYYVITKDSNRYEGRGGFMVSLDVRNSKGDKFAFDLDEDFLGKDKDFLIQGAFDGVASFDANYDTTLEVEGILKKGAVVEITLDKDGDPKEVVFMKESTVVGNEKIETDDSKVKAVADGLEYKLKSNTVVFYDETKEAILFGAAADEFDEVKDATIYAENGNIVAIVGKVAADTKTVLGVLKNDNHVSRLAGGYYEFKLEVNGKSEKFITEDDYAKTVVDGKGFEKGDVIVLKISNSTGKIVENAFDKAAGNRVIEGFTYKSSRGNKFITLSDDKQYELNSNAVIYSKDLKTNVNLSDLEKGDDVTLYRDAEYSRYIQYVIFGGVVGGSDDTAKGTITYINVEENLIEVDGEVLELATRVRLVDADGKTVEIGKDKVVAKLAELDEEGEVVLTEITSEDGIVTEMKLAKVEEEEPEVPGEDEITAEFGKGAISPTIKVTSNIEGAIKYQVFKGAEQLTNPSDLGTSVALLFTEIGDEVKVEVLDAQDNVVGTETFTIK